MTTNAQAIDALEKSKKALQDQLDSADKDTLGNLQNAIHNISSEIGKLEKKTLETAPYIPQTNAFKKATAEAQAFLATLNALKTVFADIGAVASAIDAVINLIAKLVL